MSIASTFTRTAKALALCSAPFLIACDDATKLTSGAITIRTDSTTISVGTGSRLGRGHIGPRRGGGTLINCFEKHERYRTRTICPDANGKPTTVATYQDPGRTLNQYRILNGRSPQY